MKTEKIKTEQIVNLTPHELVLFVGGNTIKFPSEGVIRVSEVTEVVQNEPMRVVRKKLSNVDDAGLELVKEHIKKGKYVVVSMLTAKALKEQLTKDEQKHILIVGETVRDERGRIIGAKSLAVVDTL